MIVLINPNSTQSMTTSMLATARAAAPNAQIDGWTSHDGPAAIQGPTDGDLAAPPLLALVQKANQARARAVIIGCFDDTALSEARKIAHCPVIGIGQAALYAAASIAERFSVITTLPVSVPIIADNIARYGLSSRVSQVRASDVPVLALETDPDAATAQVISEIVTAEREDNITAAVLGCGGMVDIAQQAAAQSSLHLIDGVRVAALIAATL